MVRVGVAKLREELEQLFPGKWLSGGESPRALKSGIEHIDNTLAAGLIRRHLTEWVGGASSGKTTVLRSICANWCATGLSIIYVDTFDRLLASDWSEIGSPSNFWVLRSSRNGLNGQQINAGNSTKYDCVKNALWACEQLIRSRAFDVVIIDLADRGVITSNIYARLKRSLERSNASLIVLRDNDSDDSLSSQSSSSGWGANSRVDFGFVTPIKIEHGVNGPVALVPTIRGSISKDGMSKSLEVSVAPYVANRLFTHSPVPDRRTPKKR